MNAITETIARKVLETVDAGLCSGVGIAKPGEMCVEAAVCYAMGLPHGDNPPCVAPALRSLKIGINDCGWSSKAARAKGLRRIAIAQLGSAGVLDEVEFMRRVARLTITSVVAKALRHAASIHTDIVHKEALIAAADRCEAEGSEAASKAASWAARWAASWAASAAREAASAASRAASEAASAASAASEAASKAASEAASKAASKAASEAASKAASDKLLADFAEDVVQILIDMNAPGVQWLDLAPKE